MSDHKILPTVNGVPVSLTGHTHTVSQVSDTIALKASPAANQSVSSGVYTKLNMAAKEYDLGAGNNNWVDSSFTPPPDTTVGIYRIAMQVTTTSNTTGYLAVFKNDAFYQTIEYQPTNTSFFSGYTDMYLQVGDVIDVRMKPGGNRTVQPVGTSVCISSIF